MGYDYIIGGAGFSGSVLANLLAEDGNSVLLVDKREHIGGNMYDYTNKYGLLVHKYGPHILTTNSDEIISYLSKFTEWHKLNIWLEAFVDHKFVPFPINLNSIDKLYEKERAEQICNSLIKEYGLESTVNVLTLLKSNSSLIKTFAEEILQKVFYGYNIKMWNLAPKDVDVNVIGRAPIKVSYDNFKFKTKYQVVPEAGYTAMFNNMLANKNITVCLNTDICDVISIEKHEILAKGKKYKGRVIYTAPVDELFSYKYGRLPYRSLHFKVSTLKKTYQYSSAAISFPQTYKKTRTSEMKYITGQKDEQHTVLVSEYPGNYDPDSKFYNNPSYPVLSDDSTKMIEKYKEDASTIKNLYLTGRLAEFKYFNMEDTINSAFSVYRKLREEDK